MSLKRVERRRFLASAGAVIAYTTNRVAKAARPQAPPILPTHPLVPTPSIPPVEVPALSPLPARVRISKGKVKTPPAFANPDYQRNPYLRPVGPVYSPPELHGPPPPERSGSGKDRQSNNNNNQTGNND
jgi:hypothetical protein